jgi:hypothetical protein
VRCASSVPFWGLLDQKLCILPLTLPLSLAGAPALSPMDCTDGNQSAEVTSLVAESLTQAALLLKKPALPTGRWGADDSKKPKHEPVWLERAVIEVITRLALAHHSPSAHTLCTAGSSHLPLLG